MIPHTDATLTTITAAADGISHAAPSGGAALLATGIALTAAARNRRKTDAADVAKRTGTLRALAWRAASGAPLSPSAPARPWLRPAPPILTDTDATPTALAQAATPKKVSLVKKQRRIPKTVSRSLPARGLRRALRATRPVLHTLRKLGATYYRWPRLAVSATRLTAAGLLLAALLPAGHPYALTAASAALAAFVAAAITGPGGLRLWHHKRRSDADIYGPRAWTLLRAHLGLEAEADRAAWLRLPDHLHDPSARITLRLPRTLAADEMWRQSATALLNSRVPGDWVARWEMLADPPRVTWKHKPDPKPAPPEPEPPSFVDLWDPRIQDALLTLREDEFVLGIDERQEIIIRKMSGELSHWALSVGSGGGKSTTLQWLAVQMLQKRGTIVGIDPKLISLKPLEGIDGVHLYKDPTNALDMRHGMEWVADVLAARYFEWEQGTRTEFPPLYLFLEEANELTGLLRATWNRIRVTTGESKDPTADPIWEDVVAYILRFGRAANVHIVSVFQDMRDDKFGGTSLQPLFRLKALGNYDPRQWDRITGMSRTIMPPNVDKAGRMVVVTEGMPLRYQTPYPFLDTEEGGKRPATELEAIKIFHSLYEEKRAAHEYKADGLYTAPPAPSPRGMPKLIRQTRTAASRDLSADGQITAQGAPSDGTAEIDAGHGVTFAGAVTPAEASVTDLRDRFRHLGEAGRQEGEEDPLAPPELLPLAEISRRLGGVEGIPKWDTLRAHKHRKADFPKGVEIGGKEHWTESQILAYYSPPSEREA